MSYTEPSSPQPLELWRACRDNRGWIVIPTLFVTAAAIAYTLLFPRPWEAMMPLLVRDEAIGHFRRPGSFDSADALKTAQETVLELARSRAVVRAALTKIGPPETFTPESDEPKDQWPTMKSVEYYQKKIKVQPPKGSEFGKTEVFHLLARIDTPERAVAFADAICNEMDQRLQQLRDRKSKGLVNELSKTVTLAREDLAEATQRLSAVEVQVGADLGELRILSESSTGDSNLRQNLNELKNELLQARTEQKTHSELLKSLSTLETNPTQVTAVPNDLLKTQPSLQKIKDSYIDAQLERTKLRGDFADGHPFVLAAFSRENEVRGHLEREVRDTIRSIHADMKITAGRIESLQQQHDDVSERMLKLAGVRATYANLQAEVKHHSEILQKAVQDLSDARASQAASFTSSQISRLDEPSTGSEPSGLGAAMVILAGAFSGLMSGVGGIYAKLALRETPPSNAGDAPITLVPADWIQPLREMATKASNKPWEEAVGRVVPARFQEGQA